MLWIECPHKGRDKPVWVCVSGRLLPGLLSVGGDSRSLIWASFNPSTHWTSRVRRGGQLDVHRAETATQEQPDRSSTRRPAGAHRSPGFASRHKTMSFWKRDKNLFHMDTSWNLPHRQCECDLFFKDFFLLSVSLIWSHKINQYERSECSYLISWWSHKGTHK